MVKRKKIWKRIVALALSASMAAPALAVIPGQTAVYAADDEKGLIADFSFDDEENGFKGAGAAAEIAGSGGEIKLSDDTGSGSGKSLDMDGSYYLEVEKEDGSALLSGCEELTVSYLSKSESDSFWSYYAQDASSDPLKRDYIGVLDKGQNVTAERGNGTGGSASAGLTSSSDGWKMVTVVYKPNKMTLYLNGQSKMVEVTDLNLSELFGEDNRFVIGAGAWNNWSEVFKGNLDEFQVYNYAMSEDEVINKYSDWALSRGLIADFSFDDEETGFKGAGAVAQITGSGTAQISDDAVAGNGSSLLMDGSYYLNVVKEDGTPLLSGCEELTVSYLSKSESDGFWSYFAQDTSSAPTDRDYIGVLDKGPAVTAERGNGTGGSAATSLTSPDDGWKLVTVVYEKNKTTLYLNDKSQSFDVPDFDFSEMIGGDNVFAIGAGAWNSWTECFKGNIDEFRVYNYAMSEDEVMQLYDARLSAQKGMEELKDLYAPKIDLSNVFTDGAVMKSEQVTLPAQVEHQDETVQVSWKSSDESVISPTGEVNYEDEDATVTLTAVLTNGEQTVEQEYSIPVLSKVSQGESFLNDFVLRSYVMTGDELPSSYGSGTLTYSGSDLITADGKVLGDGTESAVTEVTVAFALDGIEKTKKFSVTVLPETAEKFLCYTRKSESYRFTSENITYALHLAASRDGEAFSALHDNTGILFASGYYNGDDTMATKLLDRPYLFYMKDGSYAVIAKYADMGKVPTDPQVRYDEDHKGMAAVYTTDDLLHYSAENFIRLSDDAYVNNAVCEYDTSSGLYVIHWEDSNGKFWRTTMEDVLDDSTIKETVPSNIMTFESAGTDIEGAVPRNILPVSDEIGSHVVTKLSKIVNTEVNVPESVNVKSAADIDAVTATAVYSDGSEDEKEVIWDYSNVDFNSEGKEYTITGTVQSGNDFGFGNDLNDGGMVQCYNPEGEIGIRDGAGNIVEGRYDSAQNWADPNICCWNGKYYFVSTNDWNGNIGIFIRESDTIKGLFEDGVSAHEIVSYDEAAGNTGSFWAPELHAVDGKLCMFFAIGLYSRVIVLEGDDPTDQADWGEIHEVVYADELVPEGGDQYDKYFNRRSMAIDMTYFESGGKSYVVWSGREVNNGWGKGAFLYIATCDKEQPWVLTSKAVMIGKTELSWEQNHGVVQEGPFVVKNNGKIYMTYSGASVDNTYSVSFMTAEDGADLLDISNWTKNGYPILSSESVPGIYGPGHSCFIPAENGDILFVYHGRGPNWDSARTVGIRRLHFDADGEPYLAMTDAEDVLEENRTVTMKVIVGDEPAEPEKTLEKIVVTPDRTEYETGESIDVSKWKVEAVYSDNTSEVLSAGQFTTDAASIDMATAGTKTVTVTYEEEGREVTAQIEITVIEASGEGDDQKPGEDDQKPGEDDQKPGEDDQKPGEDDQKPGEDDQKPGGGDDQNAAGSDDQQNAGKGQNPGNSSSTDNTETSDAVQTGDRTDLSMILLPAVLTAGSAAAAVMTVRYRKRRG